MNGLRWCWRGMLLSWVLMASAQATELAPGVTYTLYTLPGPVKVHVVAADRLRSEYKFEVGWAQKKRNYTARQGTSTIAGLYDAPPGHDVLSAVNGSYFDTITVPRLLGIGQSAGEMLDTPSFNSSYTYHTFMIGPSRWPTITTNFAHAQGTLTFADGYQIALTQYNFYMNGPLVPIHGITAFTPAFDSSTRTSFLSPSIAVEVVLNDVSYPMRGDKEVAGIVAAIRTGTAANNNAIPAGGMVLSSWGSPRNDIVAHTHIGDRLKMRFRSGAPEYNNSDNAITGIGWIVHQGAAYPAGWTNLESGASPGGRNPRTVLAWNHQYLYQVVCDGRSTASLGMTFAEMASFLTGTLGAAEAVNMDGGGSSTMVVNGAVVNTPSDGNQRLVANAVMLVKQDTATVFPVADAFGAAGRLAGWDDKFAYNGVEVFAPVSPEGDGYVLRVTEPGGGVNTARRGDFGDADYSVEAEVYCEYRPGDAADGFERGGLFSRDSGTGALGLSTYGGGDCYAMVYDTDSGAVRAGKYVQGVFTDFLPAGAAAVTATGWHRFRLDCYGPTMRFWLDGERIGWAHDRTFVRGYFGVGNHEFFATAANAHGTRVDNFRAFVDPDGWAVRGDSDDDNDVDLVDFGRFQACYAGADQPQTVAACAWARLDADDDVDGDDLKMLRACFSGPGIHAPAACVAK